MHRAYCTPNIPLAPLRCTGTRSSHHCPDRALRLSRAAWLTCTLCKPLMGPRLQALMKSAVLTRRGECGIHTIVICARAQGCSGQSLPQGVAAWIVQGGCRAWLLVLADAPTSELIQHILEPGWSACLASAVTNKSMATSRSNLCTNASRCLSVHRRSELHCVCIWTMHMCRSDSCSGCVRSVLEDG
jgi:hypothetical protein